MNKKAFTIALISIGLLLVGLGYFKAPLHNEDEIRTIYRCDRLTKESVSTDKYCSKPENAPEAKKNLANSYVYAGTLLVVIGTGNSLTGIRKR